VTCLSYAVEIDLEFLPGQRLRASEFEMTDVVSIPTDGCVKSGHFGLVGIRERVKSIAGTVAQESARRGTEIMVTVRLSPVEVSPPQNGGHEGRVKALAGQTSV